MGTTLVTFVYTTMRKRLNNPDSRYWLPTVLGQVQAPDGGTLNPLRAPSWQLDTLKSEHGAMVGNTIADSWWQVVGHIHYTAKRRKKELVKQGREVPPELRGLPENLDDFISARSEAHPWPSLSFSSLDIHHLPNAAVGELTELTKTADGYRGTVRITLGAYNTGKWADKNRIRITGRYRLRQEVVAADDSGDDSTDPLPPTTTVVRGLEGVSWPTQVVEGKGRLTLTVQDLAFDVGVGLHISGSGLRRTLAARVDSIGVAADSRPTFSLAEEDLTIEDEWTNRILLEGWKESALNAIRHPDAGAAFRAAMEAALSDPGQCKEFSTTITQQLTAVLDGVLVPVPDGALPTGESGAGPGPVEQYLFDRVRYAVNSPSSDFYPPAVVHSIQDPGLAPLRIASLDLGEQSIDDIELSSVRLHDITLEGIPNVLIPPQDAQLTAQGIDVGLRFGRITGRPDIPGTRGADDSPHQVPEPPLVLTGRFEALFPPDDEDEDDVIRGDITATVMRPSLLMGLVFDGPDADALQISVPSLDLELSPEELTVDVATGDVFREVIRTLFNSPGVKAKILQEIRARATAQKDEIAAGLTAATRDIIAANLTQ
ncbi:hypothetical protein [Streptomyces sp. EN23]|uniref:hypothetical protein n=1 Tax=Streptomyces sp. EN23 TaxID=212774 RepID=UPI0009A0520C|nr:hypothetical protein [Streptomyces sp. EN23]